MLTELKTNCQTIQLRLGDKITMQATDKIYYTTPLSDQAHADGKKFSSHAQTKEKVKQIYLNTLAVHAVNDFINWLHYDTDLEAGESWNPITRRFQDVADLVIPDLGILECRPVLPGESVISLPRETLENRLVYIGVQFQDQLNQVELLGYYRASKLAPNQTEIPIEDLEPIETLGDYLFKLETQLEKVQNDEDIQEKLSEKVPDYSLSDYVLGLIKLERSYHQNSEYIRIEGGSILREWGTGRSPSQPVSMRRTLSEPFDFDDEDDDIIEWQNLAEDIVDLLKDDWDEDITA